LERNGEPLNQAGRATLTMLGLLGGGAGAAAYYGGQEGKEWLTGLLEQREARRQRGLLQ